MYYESPKEIYRLPSLILTKKLFCMQHLIILQLKKKKHVLSNTGGSANS